MHSIPAWQHPSVIDLQLWLGGGMNPTEAQIRFEQSTDPTPDPDFGLQVVPISQHPSSS